MFARLTLSQRWYAAQKLKAALRENDDNVVKDVKFYVYIPSADLHANHVVGEVAAQCVFLMFTWNALHAALRDPAVTSGTFRQMLKSFLF